MLTLIGLESQTSTELVTRTGCVFKLDLLSAVDITGLGRVTALLYGRACKLDGRFLTELQGSV